MQSRDSASHRTLLLLGLLLLPLASAGCGSELPAPPVAPPIRLDRESPVISNIEHNPSSPGTDTRLEIRVEARDLPSESPSGLDQITIAITRDPEGSTILSVIDRQYFTVSGDSAECTFVGGPYDPGEFYYQAVACDQAKNCSAPTVRTLRIQDRHPPTVTVSITPTNPTNFDELIIDAKASDQSKLESISVWVDRHSAAVNECSWFLFPKTGSCQHKGRYDAGTMEYWGIATDKEGNTGQSERRSIRIRDTGYVELNRLAELLPVSSASGTVSSTGEVKPSILEVGERIDGSDRVELRGFLTYDLSDLPAGAQILEAEMTLLASDLDTEGAPIPALGRLQFHQLPYDTLDRFDYDEEPALLVLEWFIWFTDGDLEEALATSLEGGQHRLQLRLQFQEPTADDGHSNFVTIKPEHYPKLAIRYRCVTKRTDAESPIPQCIDNLPFGP